MLSFLTRLSFALSLLPLNLSAQPSCHPPQCAFHTLGSQSEDKQTVNFLGGEPLPIIKPEQGAVAFADDFWRRTQFLVQLSEHDGTLHLGGLAGAGSRRKRRFLDQRQGHY